MKKQTQNCKGLLLFLFFFPIVLFAQETITGKVINESTGEGVPFINVVESGTNNGTATDIDGNFSLIVNNLPITLRVFSIGFTEKSVNVENTDAITIQVAESLESLDEVVVTGLGSSIKRANLWSVHK